MFGASLKKLAHPYRGSEMISFMAWSQLAVEEMSLSLRSSRNACFASSLVAYCGLDKSLGGGEGGEGWRCIYTLMSLLKMGTNFGEFWLI